MLFGCFFNSHFVFVSGKHISFLNACAFGFAVITITDKPSKVNIFFTGENSYIDGSSLSTGISNPIIIQKKNDGKWFNLSGQQVDKSYKGVVIVNGKKFVNK